MTPNKVENFQDWRRQFKNKPVVVKISDLPKESDYKKSHTYKINEVEIEMPKEDTVYLLTITTK
jgi:hypothetical protein